MLILRFYERLSIVLESAKCKRAECLMPQIKPENLPRPKLIDLGTTHPARGTANRPAKTHHTEDDFIGQL